MRERDHGDTLDADAYASVFTEDAVYETPTGVYEGRAAIRKIVTDLQASRDRALAARLLEDYVRDISESEEMTLTRWKRRPLWEKIVGPFVWILERQQ